MHANGKEVTRHDRMDVGLLLRRPGLPARLWLRLLACQAWITERAGDPASAAPSAEEWLKCCEAVLGATADDVYRAVHALLGSEQS